MTLSEKLYNEDKKIICFRFGKEVSLSDAFDKIQEELDGDKGEIRKINEKYDCTEILIKIVETKKNG